MHRVKGACDYCLCRLSNVVLLNCLADLLLLSLSSYQMRRSQLFQQGSSKPGHSTKIGAEEAPAVPKPSAEGDV